MATGGGLGNFIGDYIGFEAPYEDYNKLLVLSGMSSALGALFPTPVLSAMMIHELGDPPRTYMESTLVMSIAACIAFAVYYEMVGVTYLDKLSPDGINVSIYCYYKYCYKYYYYYCHCYCYCYCYHYYNSSCYRTNHVILLII